MNRSERDEEAMTGAVSVLAALSDVPESKRIDALAMACDAFCKGALE